jgi:hypothetical protein
MTRLEDGNLYLRLRTMSHTFYAAKFEQTISHQHVHLTTIFVLLDISESK